ncbi:MAG: SDR family NAD(P)-dependent oxidoreductase [Planktomarina sp.]|jgi:NAD(P)-dependent dehydrogenase (short-subunit alcohol dehydrogenase family)|nr:SDR family NAD(P)-dependent oxidoreductase [Planktomarina sp.]
MRCGGGHVGNTPYLSAMKQILIIGASGAIGTALAETYQNKGWKCAGLSRKAQGLDFTQEQTIADAMATVTGPFDTIVVATGALTLGGIVPEKTIKAATAQTMAAQMLVNAIGPALILGRIGAFLPRDRPARVAVLSARVGSIGDNRLGGWISYRAAKAALNQILRTSAIELARSHPQLSCFALHPGTVDTPLTRPFSAKYDARPPSEAAARLHDVIEARGAHETGQFFDQNGRIVPW